jgi:hypothetical protein
VNGPEVLTRLELFFSTRTHSQQSTIEKQEIQTPLNRSQGKLSFTHKKSLVSFIVRLYKHTLNVHNSVLKTKKTFQIW